MRNHNPPSICNCMRAMNDHWHRGEVNEGTSCARTAQSESQSTICMRSHDHWTAGRDSMF